MFRRLLSAPRLGASGYPSAAGRARRDSTQTPPAEPRGSERYPRRPPAPASCPPGWAQLVGLQGETAITRGHPTLCVPAAQRRAPRAPNGRRPGPGSPPPPAPERASVPPPQARAAAASSPPRPCRRPPAPAPASPACLPSVRRNTTNLKKKFFFFFFRNVHEKDEGDSTIRGSRHRNSNWPRATLLGAENHLPNERGCADTGAILKRQSDEQLHLKSKNDPNFDSFLWTCSN